MQINLTTDQIISLLMLAGVLAYVLKGLVVAYGDQRAEDQRKADRDALLDEVSLFGLLDAEDVAAALPI